METSARLLRLLSLLQARPTWSGPELADRLGVTGRTLRRDVARLRSLGYPVEAQAGPYGGYRLVAGGALPPLLLGDDEAVAVALALRAAAGGVLPGFEDPVLAALSKIEQVLPARLRERIATLDSATVQVGRASLPAGEVDVSALVTIAGACRGPERMRFTYRDGAGNVSERHVEPYQLVRAGRRWYLVARDRDRDDWRSFRVDRMSDLAPTGMRFIHRDPPDAAGFVAQGVALGGYRFQARLLLEVEPDLAARFVPPTVAVLEPVDGGTAMRIGADDLSWIARFVANLPVRFTVLEPDELRDAIRDLAALLAEQAST